MDSHPWLVYKELVAGLMEAAVNERGEWYIPGDVVFTAEELSVMDLCWFRGVAAEECAAMLVADRLVPMVEGEI